MSNIRLTDTACTAAAVTDKARTIWDREVVGFGLLILPSGNRSFIFQYRNADRRSRRITIGKLGKLTARRAREIAEEHRDAVAAGRDPLAEKREAEIADTLGEVLDRYTASAKFAEKAASTQRTDRGRIALHLRPVLGKVKVESLTRDGVKAAYAKIAKDRRPMPGTTRLLGGPGTARKCIKLLSAALAWAVEEKIAERNVAARIKTGRDGKRTTVLDADDYKRLFSALGEMEQDGRIPSVVADLFRLIALTGCRKSEATLLRWRDVNLRDGLIVLREHKTAESSKEDRIVGLPAAAQEVLARQQNAADPDAFVFSLSGGRKPIFPQRYWNRVKEAARLDPAANLHQLRHSLATTMAQNGASAVEIATVMGHKSITTSMGYIHAAKTYRQQIAERAASMMTASLAAASGSTPAPVAELPRGRRR